MKDHRVSYTRVLDYNEADNAEHVAMMRAQAPDGCKVRTYQRAVHAGGASIPVVVVVVYEPLADAPPKAPRVRKPTRAQMHGAIGVSHRGPRH